MIRLISVLLIPFIIMTACVDTGQSVTQPESGYSSSWRDGGSAEEICHEYMELLGEAQTLHYAVHNAFTDNIGDLQEFLEIPVESIYCPVNGEYLFSGDISNEYYIECPTGAGMSHGHIWNGYTSWPPDPSEHTEICHARMITLATACSMYYGMYNRFPEVLSDLEEVMGNWDVECPACDTMYLYETNPEGDTYTITCPLSPDHNHGSIVDGYLSW